MEYTIINPGTIMYLDGYFYDQLSGIPDDDTWDRWIYQNSFMSYIKWKYDLEYEEYYGIVVKNDKNYKKKCDNPECNNYTKFISLGRGYAKYCSNECQIHNTWFGEGNLKRRELLSEKLIKYYEEHPEAAERQANNLREIVKSNWENPEIRARMLENLDNINSRKSELMRNNKWYQCNLHRAYLISHIDPIAYFYIADLKDSDEIKIGVTNDYNLLFSVKSLDFSFTSIRIFEALGEILPELEFSIKMDFTSSRGLEYFDKALKGQILDYIKNFELTEIFLE